MHNGSFINYNETEKICCYLGLHLAGKVKKTTANGNLMQTHQS